MFCKKKWTIKNVFRKQIKLNYNKSIVSNQIQYQNIKFLQNRITTTYTNNRLEEKLYRIRESDVSWHHAETELIVS